MIQRMVSFENLSLSDKKPFNGSVTLKVFFLYKLRDGTDHLIFVEG